MIASEGFIPLQHLYDEAFALAYDQAVEYMHSITEHAGHLYMHRTQDILMSWFEDFYEEDLYLSNGQQGPTRISKWPIKHRFYVDIHCHGRPDQYGHFLTKHNNISLKSKFGICNLIPERWLTRPEDPDDEPTEEEWLKFKLDAIESFGGTTVLLFVNYLKWTIDLSLFNCLMENDTRHWENFGADVIEHADYLQRFEGYSLCVSERHFFDKWAAHWSNIGSRRLADHRRFVMDGGASENASGQIGRPRKREALADCYRALFPQGNRGLPWKQVLREIELQYGISGSVETLKRGLKIEED